MRGRGRSEPPIPPILAPSPRIPQRAAGTAADREEAPVGGARRDEQQVGQAVEVWHDLGVRQAALGGATVRRSARRTRSGDVQRGAGHRFAGDHELGRLSWRASRVSISPSSAETISALTRVTPRSACRFVDMRRQLGADDEQLTLEPVDEGGELCLGPVCHGSDRCPCQAERGDRLIGRAVGVRSEIRLADPGAAEQNPVVPESPFLV